MNTLLLLAVGKVNVEILLALRAAIPRVLDIACEILPYVLDPTPSYHPERQQYHSSELLQQMQTVVRPNDWRFLAVADVDLYIPILKYVFGEAQIGGPSALVSMYRLRQEFYGLAPDPALLAERILKECVHELGHTLDLRHCQDYRCVMASSHAVEWIDLRETAFCKACLAEVHSSLKRPTVEGKV